MGRPFLAVTTITLVVASAACGSSASASDDAGTGATGTAATVRVGPADDAVAMRDLQASDQWTNPRCRWLESGAWVKASVQEEAIYRAAYQMQFIDMTEVGQEYHLNRQAPVWRITLTDRGETESATCGPTSNAESWGVPVSKRRFIAGKFVKQEDYGRTVYEVSYEWIPTPVGDQVEHVLTNHMAVEHGAFSTKVYMSKGRGAGGIKWTVDAIDDRGAARTR